MQKFPRVVDLNVNGTCNLNCFFCYGPAKDALELGTDQIKESIDKLHAGGVEFVSITGGEPTLREDLLDLVSHINAVGMQCALHTNGHFLRSNDPLLEHLNWLALPLDGANQESHHRMRGDRVGFDRVTKFLNWYRHSKFRPQLKVKIGTVATRKNIDQLPAIANVLAGTGISVWKIHEFRARGMGSVSHPKVHIQSREIESVVETIKSSSPGFKISYSAAEKSDGAYMFIYPNGEVRVPTVDGYKIYGNLLDPGFSFEFGSEMSARNFNNNLDLAYGI